MADETAGRTDGSAERPGVIKKYSRAVAAFFVCLAVFCVIRYVLIIIGNKG